MNKPDLQKTKERFLSYLQGIRALSSLTVKAYGEDLKTFGAFLKSEGVGLNEVDYHLIRGFLSWLSQKKRSVATINRMLSTLRTFFHYLCENNLLSANPMSEIQGLRFHHELPSFLFVDEMEKLLLLPEDDFWGVRDRLILELLYSTGCRVAELAAMDIKHVDLAERMARVKGKGNKERMVILGRKVCEVFVQYLKRRKIFNWRQPVKNGVDIRQAGPLILNRRGGRMSSRGIAMLLEKYSSKLDFGKRISPHAMRHSFATHLMDNGADIRMVQEMLGHKSLSTTQIYTHVGLSRLKKIHSQAHPHSKPPRGSINIGNTEGEQE